MKNHKMALLISGCALLLSSSPVRAHHAFAAEFDADTIRYEATMEDQKVFTRAWKISMPLYRRLETDAQLMEYKCVEFAEELMYGPLSKPTP